MSDKKSKSLFARIWAWIKKIFAIITGTYKPKIIKTHTGTGLDSFDNIVVLMLENRSFDNLLGSLFEKEGVPSGKSFAGLQDYHKEMPVPPRAKDYDKHKFVPVQKAQDFHQPFPDPGEEYQHVNTQLYNFISEGNTGTPEADMLPPYNIPSPLPSDNHMMLGFVNDYINTMQGMHDKKYPEYDNPTYELYKVIMQVYKTDQVSVMSQLAKSFSVFDHWHCSVPSQTWCNRAFWHAATSGGQVINPGEDGDLFANFKGMKTWVEKVWSKKTLFELFEDRDVSHGVYTEDPVSLTSIVNGPFKNECVVHTGADLSKFKKHVKKGSLPQYCFIEPKFYGQHNDQHPSSVSGLIDGPTRAGTVILGEKLIWDVYETIRNSSYKHKTLFIITHDEHGGCFDHVVPGSAVPPEQEGKTQKNFPFDRLGIRVPMVMISSHIPEGSIINETFDHTSFIATMCKKFSMPSLTNRDKNANTFEHIFSKEKRDWPQIEEPIIPLNNDEVYHAHPMNDLQKSILRGAAYIASEEAKRRHKTIDLDKAAQASTVGEAMAFIEGVKHLL